MGNAVADSKVLNTRGCHEMIHRTDELAVFVIYEGMRYFAP